LDAVGFDGAAQQLAGAEDVCLSGELVELARPHSRGQWLMAGSFRRGRSARLGFSRGCKQIIARHELKLAVGRRFAQNKKTRRPAGLDSSFCIRHSPLK
jgi:hypothetical protein